MNHPAVVKAAHAAIPRALFASDEAQSRWADLVAEIIERETKYSRLVEAARFLMGEIDNPVKDYTMLKLRRDQLRSVLAEIKDLGIGPRR